MTEELTFEAKLKQLETIVTALEKGDRPLETALTDFKTGVTLAKDLQKTLQEAEKTLAKVMNDDGSMTDLELTNND
ncbi:exodeoxyribonuclease VII small subunit [Fructobacillus ficulneus]|uniref:Exodeoxyribonuclease 7 small subunit n=1 Tax=Fructobacillus ficulneus TaxID=157463 RepID=A0A0K8MIJ1_9LACO|nr:exodeoxyribonuclease VII small subunit [Fructobacillus ficulneus]GAO99699.1 exodeoxyribonuclease VII small subunit [Fructobacillus ficulneus]